MTPWQALLLGVLQGLTEFLPVSSSGHLALAQMMIPGFEQPGVVFDAMLHVGTAGAVLWFERQQLVGWLVSASGRHLLVLLALGTVATALVAFPLRNLAEGAFHRPLLVGLALMVTGLVVAGTRWLPGGSSDERTTTWRQVTAVGLVQGLAVFPGFSRSGFTIAASLGAGLDRAWAARFSFLLSVPVIIAATVAQVALSADELGVIGSAFWIACVVGAVSAGLTGYFALKIVVRAVSSEIFHRFAWYCIPLGLAVVTASVVLR
jgi:undecaprenyl-diphosphatase